MLLQVLAVDFSPDEQMLAVGVVSIPQDANSGRIYPGRVYLWRLENLSEPQVLEKESALKGVLTLDFRADGRYLATGDQGGNILIWDLVNNQPQRLYRHDDVWAWSVSFDPIGERLSSVGDDGSLYQVSLKGLLNPTPKPQNIPNIMLRALAYAPPVNPTLATAGNDQKVRLWNPENLDQRPVVLYGHDATVRTLAFSPDGALLASAGNDGVIRVWTVSLSALQKAACTRLVEPMSREVWQTYFDDREYQPLCETMLQEMITK